jgi:hypothetical protein
LNTSVLMTSRPWRHRDQSNGGDDGVFASLVASCTNSRDPHVAAAITGDNHPPLSGTFHTMFFVSPTDG